MEHNNLGKRTPIEHHASELPGKVRRRIFHMQSAAVAGAAASAGLARGVNAQGLAGQPSRFESPVVRHLLRPYGDLAPGSGAALTPLESIKGIITPSSPHNVRNHSGTPDIDFKRHQLLLQGLVARPLTFSIELLLWH